MSFSTQVNPVAVAPVSALAQAHPPQQTLWPDPNRCVRLSGSA
ncbi:hypothetical protein Hanom_Chr08g00710541 [Helianthus anomalus]